MSVKSDRWIIEMATRHRMIEPFETEQVRVQFVALNPDERIPDFSVEVSEEDIEDYYDAHEEDLLGQMTVTDHGFKTLAGIVKGFADDLCDGRLVACLEGGYTVEVQARNVHDTLEVFGE